MDWRQGNLRGKQLRFGTGSSVFLVGLLVGMPLRCHDGRRSALSSSRSDPS